MKTRSVRVPEAIAHEAGDVRRVVAVLAVCAGARRIRVAEAGVRERAVQSAGTLEAALIGHEVAKPLVAERIDPRLALSVEPRLLVSDARLLVPPQHHWKRSQLHIRGGTKF